MLSTTKAYATNNPIIQYNSLERIAILVGWIRQITIQLTAVLVGMFFMSAVLEVDLGETGDSFGDVYDTYMHSAPVQTPKPTMGACGKFLPAQPIITPYKRPLSLSVNWAFVLALAPLAMYVCREHRPPKGKRPQVMLAVWRL
ncbi:hypothetical protein GCM10028807_41270 [Spirosoma daeguense]